MNIPPNLTENEIQSIDHILQKTGVFCTPIFIKKLGSSQQEFGSSRGTLSIVESEQRVFLVTAAHVIEDNIRNFAFSPIGRKWESIPLNGYDWRHLSANENFWSPSIDIDLAIAELSPTELSVIDPTRIQPMEPASNFDSPFVAAMSGYLNKKHNRNAIKARGRARPTTFGLTSEGIKPRIRPPLAIADPPLHIKFPFDRNNAVYWEQRELIENHNTASQPNGLSGGPVLYCRKRNPYHSIGHAPVVIGFLIEQSDYSGTVTMVASDVVYRSVSPIAKR